MIYLVITVSILLDMSPLAAGRALSSKRSVLWWDSRHLFMLRHVKSANKALKMERSKLRRPFSLVLGGGKCRLS